MFFDPLYVIILMPAIIFSMIASFKVKSTFAKYSRAMCGTRLTGYEAAEKMLNRAGIRDVRIERVDGMLTDHYDPRSKVLRLSKDVYGSSSLGAVGVACHEAGHAIQHAEGYSMLKMRTALVPITSFGSNFGIWIIVLGAFLASIDPSMIWVAQLGVLLFASTVVFALVTLPVEFNASARAKKQLELSGILSSGELKGASAVLDAAFLTYVAGAASAILTLLYYLIRLGLIGGNNRD